MLLLAVASGCHIVFPIEPEGDGGPRVYSSPAPAAMLYGAYPKSFAITLASDEPGTTIYYTTDGSMPDETSTSTSSAPTPVGGITISASAMVRYYGVSLAGVGDITSESYAIDGPKTQPLAGYLVTNVTLDGTSPTVTATKGATLGARANVQFWVQGDCPGCKGQLVYGVDDTDQGCIYDEVPGSYPGVTMIKTFNVKVPNTAGIHEVRIAHTEQLSCADALAMNTLVKRRVTVTRIGVIVVP
jgi:hypothetical protein